MWKPHGFGRLELNNEGHDYDSKRIIEGYFVDGQLEGFARYYWGNGEWLEGNSKDGYADGKVIYHWPNGECYEGNMEVDEIHGKGTKYFEDETV